jgi:hypothetical protein
VTLKPLESCDRRFGAAFNQSFEFCLRQRGEFPRLLRKVNKSGQSRISPITLNRAMPQKF